MAPKKATKKAAAAEVEAPAIVTNSKGKEYATTAAVARPRRAVATSDAPPRVTRKRETTKKAAPAKKSAPVKKTTASAASNTVAGKKRGRLAIVSAQEEDDVAEPPKKRGRPAKAAPAPAVPLDEAAAPPKKRGRPPKGGETTKITADDDAAAEQLEEELVEQVEAEGTDGPSKPATIPKNRGPGRPAKGKGRAKAATATVVVTAAEEPVDEDTEDADSGKQYWLMKAEQEDRVETLGDGSTFNAKFTIDDLRAKGGPEPWDGVRNPTACKNMKDMTIGDLCFFYASGGKQGRQPGIVGIMEVVREAEPDLSAFDENHYGYVENVKNRGTEAKPRWHMVHVEYRQKLSQPVTLKELQKFSGADGVLSELQVLKQTRLSVSKVTEAEWKFIVDNLVNGYEEDEDPGPVLNGSRATAKT